jgi:hypothetical protein
MNGYYRSRSWGTVFARVIDLLRKDSMSPQRFLLLILLTGTALTLAAVAPVAAVPPTRTDVSFPKGAEIEVTGVCPGDVNLVILVLSSKLTLTTFYDQSGNVVMQLSTGPLKVRITNVETEESIDRNISGPGRIVDEGTTLIMTGRWLNIVPELGIVWLTTGRVVAEIDPATGFIVSFRSLEGTVEDVCETLAS